MTALAFDILGRDKASKAFDKVGRSADQTGRKFGFLAARTHGLTAGMTVGLGKIVAGMGAIAGIAAFTGFINDARESAKVTRITHQVIKSTGKAAHVSASQVGTLATAISNKTGADDEAIQSGQNLLLTFTNVRNEVGKGNNIFDQASQAIVDMTAALNNGEVTSEGMKSSSIQLGKALNDPIKGVTALQKVGVSFTAKQKEQIKTLVESGKTMDAQKLILAELGKEFGGAAEAAADPVSRLKTIVGNLGEQFGGFLLPAVDKAATFLSDNLPKAFGFVQTAAQAVFDTFKNGAGSGYLDAFGTRTGKVLTAIGLVARAAADKIRESVGIIKDQAVKWGGALIDGVRAGLSAGNWTPLGKTLGEGLTKAVKSIGEGASKFSAAISGLIDKVDWGALGAKISNAVHTMFQAIDWGAVGQSLGDAAVAIVRGTSTLGERLGTAFRELIKRVDWKQIGHDSTAAVAGIVSGIDWPTVAKVFLKSIIGSLKITASTRAAVIKMATDLVVGIALGLVHELRRWYGWIFGKYKEVGAGLVSGLKSGVVGAVRGIGAWFKRVLVDPIIAWVKLGFGVRSPSTVFARIGRELINGLKSGVVAAVTGIGAWMKRVVINPLLAPFAGAGWWLAQEGRDLLWGFLRGMQGVWTKVKDWVGGIAQWIRDHKGPVSLDARLLIPAGRAIMEGFLKGLQSGAGKAWEFVKSVGGKTRRALEIAQGLRDAAGNVVSFVGEGFKGSANVSLGRQLAAQRGWTGANWQALYRLWIGESGWNNLADNPTSTAFGIPQFIASTARAYGVYGVTDPARQIIAGMQYIADAYGSPVNALAKWSARSPHWYEKGTPWVPHDQFAYLHKGEAVVPAAVNRRASVTRGGATAAPIIIDGRTTRGLDRLGAEWLLQLVRTNPAVAQQLKVLLT